MGGIAISDYDTPGHKEPNHSNQHSDGHLPPAHAPARRAHVVEHQFKYN